MKERQLLCIGFALFNLIAQPALAKDDLSELTELADQLDAQDREQLTSLLRQIDNCTDNRDYACSETLLSRARKFAHGKADSAKLLSAKNKLAMERDAEAREIQARKDEEERIAKAERKRERDLERLEQQQQTADANQSRRDMYQSIGAAIAAAGQDVGNYVNSSGQALYNAQRSAQQQQLENDRKRRQINDDADRARTEANDARRRVEESSRSHTASNGVDSPSSANRNQAAAESKRQRDEALAIQKKQDQELAALQQSNATQAPPNTTRPTLALQTAITQPSTISAPNATRPNFVSVFPGNARETCQRDAAFYQKPHNDRFDRSIGYSCHTSSDYLYAGPSPADQTESCKTAGIKANNRLMELSRASRQDEVAVKEYCECKVIELPSSNGKFMPGSECHVEILSKITIKSLQ